jgi:sugar lactone lactonase YvrE
MSADGLERLLEPGEPRRLATGFVFTEGPLWHPEGFYYFVDVRASRLYRIAPGGAPELLRENTGGGNGTTFDLQGRLVLCEGENRRVTRAGAGEARRCWSTATRQAPEPAERRGLPSTAASTSPIPACECRSASAS